MKMTKGAVLLLGGTIAPALAPAFAQEEAGRIKELERKLEEGLEETMAGSDPVSITQPPQSKVEKLEQDKEHSK